MRPYFAVAAALGLLGALLTGLLVRSGAASVTSREMAQPPTPLAVAATSPAAKQIPSGLLLAPGGWPPSSTEQLARMPMQSLIDQIKQLRACHAQDRCDFEEPDSRAAHFAAAKAIAVRLKALMPHAAEPAVIALAREQLGFPDGHVQSAALALLANLPAQAALTQEVLRMLANSHDAPLLEQSLPVLSRWQAQRLPDTDATLQALLLDGPHFVGLSLSTSTALLPFITDANLPAYQRLLGRLPASRKREQLMQTLSEYQRIRSGA